jgi:DNA-binding transcriptional ArsR family regulator
METIANYGDKICAKDLAELMNMSRANAFSHLNRLKKQGLLRKEFVLEVVEYRTAYFELVVKPDATVNSNG